MRVNRKAGFIFLIIAMLTGCVETDNLTSNIQKKINNSTKEKMPTPNILWIYVEDMNDWMGAYGDNTVPTPTIDKLANEGVRFDQVIMPAAVCSAVRSAIINGDMQTSLGMHNHRSSRYDFDAIHVPNGRQTVPELFIKNGYKTFNIGKDDYNFTYDRKKLYSLAPGPEVGHQGSKNGPQFDWAKEVGDKPFFGQIQLRGGKYKKEIPPVKVDRASVTLPPYYNDQPLTRNAWARHYENIALTDIDVAGIMAQLKKNGLLDNTAVFFFTDHGMGLLRHKQFLYDGGLQVPLIISWPAGNKNLRSLGAERKEMIRGLDIAGTSLALAGIKIPDYMTTENFFADNYQPKKYVFSARDRTDYTFERIRSVRSEKFKYIRNFFPERPYMQAQYRDKWPLVKEYKKAYQNGEFNAVQSQLMAATKPKEELYDLINDPHEINNLANDKNHNNQLLVMREALVSWMKTTDDKGQSPESGPGIRGVIKMYKNRCQSPECQAYRNKNNLKGNK